MSYTEHMVSGVTILVPDETRFPTLLSRGTIIDQVRATSKAAAIANRRALEVSVALGKIDTTKITSSQGSPPELPPATPAPVKPAQPGTIVGTGFHPAGHFYDMDLTFSIGFQTRGAIPIVNVGTGGVSTTSIPDPALDDSEKDPDSIGRSYTSSPEDPHWYCQYNAMLKILQTRQEPRVTGFKLLWKIPSTWFFTDGASATMYLAVTSNPAVLIRTIQTPLRPSAASKFPKISPVSVDVIEVFL